MSTSKFLFIIFIEYRADEFLFGIWYEWIKTKCFFYVMYIKLNWIDIIPIQIDDLE